MSFSPRAKDLMGLSIVLGCAVALAFGISYYFIHYNSPSGSHKVEAVLLLGETLESLNYIDEGTAGTSARYLFDGITFQGDQQSPVDIDIKRYQEFLLLLYGDRSLVGQDAEKAPLFQGKNMAHLFLYVASPAGGRHPQRKIFQEIQILKDDYRVNLHGTSNQEQWAYFYHPEIKEKALKLLVKGSVNDKVKK